MVPQSTRTERFIFIFYFIAPVREHLLHLCESISHGQEGPGCRELCLVVFPKQRRLEQTVHRGGIVIPQPPAATSIGNAFVRVESKKSDTHKRLFMVCKGA